VGVTGNGYSDDRRIFRNLAPRDRKLIMSDTPARRADIQNDLASWCKQNHLDSKCIGGSWPTKKKLTLSL